jgi:hypothetical protein
MNDFFNEPFIKCFNEETINSMKTILEDEIPETKQFLTEIYSTNNSEKLDNIRKFFNSLHNLFTTFSSPENYKKIISDLIDTRTFIDMYNSSKNSFKLEILHIIISDMSNNAKKLAQLYCYGIDDSDLCSYQFDIMNKNSEKYIFMCRLNLLLNENNAFYFIEIRKT